MKKLNEAIISTLKFYSKNEKQVISVIIDNDVSLPMSIYKTNNKLVVLGNKFRTLYRFWNKIPTGEINISACEIDIENIPLSKGSVDFLVVGLKTPLKQPAKHLTIYRDLLKPDGLLLWINPVKSGIFSKFINWLHGNTSLLKRYELSHLAMASGYKDVGQKMLSSSFYSTIVLTIGTR